MTDLDDTATSVSRQGARLPCTVTDRAHELPDEQRWPGPTPHRSHDDPGAGHVEDGSTGASSPDPFAVELPPERRADESRHGGLPEPSRSPTVADGEWTLGRLSRLQGRIEACRDDLVTDDAATRSPDAVREVESSRVARHTAGSVPSSGRARDPLQQPGSGRIDRRSAARLDEVRISARVLSLLGRPPGRGTSPAPDVPRVDAGPAVLSMRRRAGAPGAKR